MLAKRFRLRKNFQYKYVYSKGKSIPCKHFVLLFTHSNSTNIHVGFSVSNKIGNAVIRNRIRRLLREAVRASLNSIKPNHNLVFAASSKFNFGKQTTYNEIQNSVHYTLRKAGLIKE